MHLPTVRQKVMEIETERARDTVLESAHKFVQHFLFMQTHTHTNSESDVTVCVCVCTLN